MGQQQQQRRGRSPAPLNARQRPPTLPFLLLLSCLCTGRDAALGFPQPFAGYLSESDIPKSERLALCFSQWIELSDQPQVSSSVMDLCNSMFNSLQLDEENNQEIYKRFLFHYSRAQDPTYPLKAGSFPVHPLMSLAPKLSERRMKRFLDPESQVAAAEFTKKDGLDTLGRPFFLFRTIGYISANKFFDAVTEEVNTLFPQPVSHSSLNVFIRSIMMSPQIFFHYREQMEVRRC